MRNLEKGQHIFIAFQNGKAVLDSQLRPRMYTSLENADKWTPTVNKGKIEYVEYAPTLTPPNEWVRVEERLPDSQADVLVVAFWHENWQTMIGWYSDTVKKWRVITPHGELEPGGVTHWMPLPEPPDSRQPEGEEGDANRG